MSSPLPIAKGWYPDPHTGGTRYWDGSRWTGDARPRRRPFSASHSWSPLGFLLVFVAVGWGSIAFMAYGETGNVGELVAAVVVVLVSIPIAVYLQRGRGPSTAQVEQRLAKEQKEAKAKRRAANVASVAASFRRRPRGGTSTSAPGGAVTVAQIGAISNPETARSLQSLQHLLYTQAITDEEFQAAKDKLLGQPVPDAFDQIGKLAELHRAGVIGDVEFAAAKARVLGI